MVDLPGKRKTFSRHLREEAYYINGARVEFYRRGRRWEWRALNARIKPALDTRKKKDKT